MITEEHQQVSITEHGVISSTAGVFGFDAPKTIAEHERDICEIAESKVIRKADNDNELAIVCGPKQGRLIVIDIGVGRGSFIPKLDPGRYGVEHTNVGNLLTKTKRIININNGTTSVIFGVAPEHWPDGINSCTLVQPDLEGRGVINLLADGSIAPIEPTPGYRFYTPFFHIAGAGGAFLTPDHKAKPGRSIYPPYRIGVMTLNREQLSELLRGFNADWSNGRVFAEKNEIGKQQDQQEQEQGQEQARGGRKHRKKKKKEGLDRWC